MREIKTGETIGSVECPGCGAKTALKVNTRGNVYFFCAKRLGDKPATGKQEICLTRMNYGRTGSKKIIEQFLAMEKIENVQNEIRDGGNVDGKNGVDDSDNTGAAIIQPAAIPERAAGFGDAVRRFLTE